MTVAGLTIGICVDGEKGEDFEAAMKAAARLIRPDVEKYVAEQLKPYVKPVPRIHVEAW